LHEKCGNYAYEKHNMEVTMKAILLAALLMFSTVVNAFFIFPTGPEAEQLSCANLQQWPQSYGGINGGQNVLFLSNGDDWSQYPFWANGLPITSTWKLNDNTMLVAMGCGTYSDGVYNFSLDTHQWTINEWFLRPNFVLQNPYNNLYYVGERDGLYQSTDADSWTRIVALGSNECNSIAFYSNYIVANSGVFVYYSVDNGQSWLQSDTQNLHGFRYTYNGNLYAIMSMGSESDGLWQSNDNGATWNAVYYSSNLSCIGPDLFGYTSLGWSTANENGQFVAIIDHQNQVTQLSHPDLSSPVRQIDTFPGINTLSFYVINEQGSFFLVGFAPSDVNDESAPPATVGNLQVFPNPAQYYCEVKLSGDGITGTCLSIYNLKGQLVRTINLPTDKGIGTQYIRWDLQNSDGEKVPPGMYVLSVKDKAGKRLGIGRTVVYR
jgi:hypothetical protein